MARDEIVDKVWPDTAVTDDALRFQIAELRKAFGEEGESFIQTIRREGYRWEAPVRPAADRPVRPAATNATPSPATRFRLVLGTREVQLLEGENIIGRDPDGALWIDHPSVSRRHARIVVAGGKAVLEDLDSKNGTFLDGKQLRQEGGARGRRRSADRSRNHGFPRGVVGHDADGRPRQPVAQSGRARVADHCNRNVFVRKTAICPRVIGSYRQ